MYLQENRVNGLKLKELIENEYLSFEHPVVDIEKDARLIQAVLYFPELIPEIHGVEKRTGGISVSKGSYVLSFFQRLYNDELTIPEVPSLSAKNGVVMETQLAAESSVGKVFSELNTQARDDLMPFRKCIRITYLPSDFRDFASDMESLIENIKVAEWE